MENEENGENVKKKADCTVGDGSAGVVHCDGVTLADGRYYEMDDKLELQYGVRGCRPHSLQGCNSPKVALVWLCWFCMIQGFAVNGVNNVNTTTIERRFNLPSSTVGLISSAYDFAAGILVLPITYFGANSHHPRMLAIAALFMSSGSFMMSLPHFTSGPYDPQGGNTGYCDIYGNATDALCLRQSTEGLSNYLYVFLGGQLLHGVGGTIIYTIGIIYLDDNVVSESMPIYQGFMYSSSALGPAIGYVVGGRLLNVYVDFDKKDTSQLKLTPDDPGWVGAWWVPFVVASGLFLTVFLLFLPYPRETPNAEKVRRLRVSMAHDDGGEEKVSRIGGAGSRSVRDLPTVLGVLLTNPVNMLVTFGAVTEGILTSGFMTFIPKFIQNQFGLNAGVSAMLGGGVAVPAATGGQFFGGFISRSLHLRVRGMLRLCVGLCLSVAVISFVTLSNCGSPRMSGVTVAYRNSSVQLENVALTSRCNEHCHCTARSYEPICGTDGVQYFSPCHAGCHRAFRKGDKKVYSNCSCITTAVNMSAQVAASDGRCQYHCDLIWVFMPLFFVVTFLTFSASVPATVVSLRCIPDSTKSFALGIKWMFVRFLGTVPGPVLFGAIFDSTCTVWQRRCSLKGSCWIYDNARLSINLLITMLCLKCLSAFFFGMAALCYKAPPDDRLVTLKGEGHCRKKSIPKSKVTPVNIDNEGFIKSKETVL